jgi:hypothetical protein
MVSIMLVGPLHHRTVVGRQHDERVLGNASRFRSLIKVPIRALRGVISSAVTPPFAVSFFGKP